MFMPGQQSSDTEPLFSPSHKPHIDWTTRIQVGHTRFYKLEKLIDWFVLRFSRPKLTDSNFKKKKTVSFVNLDDKKIPNPNTVEKALKVYIKGLEDKLKK